MMSNFAQSLQQGLDAARLAKSQQKEIEETFDSLRDAVKEATDHKIDLRIERRYSNNSIMDQAARALATMTSVAGQTVIEAFVVGASVNFQKLQTLANWETSSVGGYPCRLTFDNKDLICHDRESLESAFDEMLSTPLIGKKILSLISSTTAEDTLSNGEIVTKPEID